METLGTNTGGDNGQDPTAVLEASPAMTSEAPTAGGNGTEPQTENSKSTTEILYRKNRELQNRLEDLESWKVDQERRISKIEEFVGKTTQFFSNIFKRDRINKDSENRKHSHKVEEVGYLSQRQSLDDYENQLRSQGTPEDEIKEKMKRFNNAMPFEGGYNLDPANQIPNRGEISEADYYAQRPTFEDWRKDQITEAGGVTPEVARQSLEMRDRLNATPQEKASTLARAGQQAKQLFQRKGTNLDSQNQIQKEEFTTLGKAIDSKTTDKESAQAMVNLYYDNNAQPTPSTP